MNRSRRQYCTIAELENYADIDVTDDNEAYDQISQAEAIVDAYVGRISKHIRDEFVGKATGGTTTTLIDTSDDSHIYNDFGDNYFTFCELQIIGGTNAGQSRPITGYDKSAGQVTVDYAFSSAIDSTSVYRIHQIGKFPRNCDYDSLTENGEVTYYKWIPEEIKQATLAQVAYIVELGPSFLNSDASDKISEGIGDYNYQKKVVEAIIAPKARNILRRYLLRTGEIEDDHPSF